MDNNQALKEINETLIGLTGKPIVAIFAPGQNGDTQVCTSVLKYKDELWPDMDIVWFANYPVADVLRYAPINEVRPWLWAGNGLPEGTPDYWPMLTNQHKRLNQELKLNFPETADLYEGYFPCPYMTEPIGRHNVEYSNVSKKVFGVPDELEWHPFLSFSESEREYANDYMSNFKGGKVVAIESFAGSGQSRMSDEMIRKTIEICRDKWAGCKFIMLSHKFLRDNETFPDWYFEQKDIFFAGNFTVRQCALLVEQTHLMISVSSGVTVASSAWGLKQPPTIQLTGSKICSTYAIRNCRFELVTCDDKMFSAAQDEYYLKLNLLLNENQ